MNRATVWSVSYYVEAERYWQTAGEGPKQWALGRRRYLLDHAPRLAVRLRRRSVYIGRRATPEAGQ